MKDKKLKALLQEPLLPGVGAGGLRFGDQVEAVISIWGEPTKRTKEAHGTSMVYPGLSLFINAVKGLSWLTVRAPYQGQTPKGLKVGTPSLQAHKIYPKAQQNFEWMEQCMAIAPIESDYKVSPELSFEITLVPSGLKERYQQLENYRPKPDWVKEYQKRITYELAFYKAEKERDHRVTAISLHFVHDGAP